MKNTWITSDTHFGHAGVCRFLNNDGTKLRPWDNPDDMDEAMVELWNDKVKPGDKVYHLGDVVINRRCLKTLSRLNGDLVLIKGNHDCLDEETELLTDRGWVRYDQILESDKVLSVDNNQQSTWCDIDEVFVQHRNEQMVSLETGRMSMVVTENHRVAVLNDKNEIDYVLAGNLFNTSKIKLITSATSTNKEFPITDDEIEFLAWVYTDGSIYEKHDGVSIWQSKETGIKKIEDLLARLGLPYKKISKGIKKKGTMVCGKALKKDSREAFHFSIPAEFSSKFVKMIGKNKKRLANFIFEFSTRQATLFLDKLVIGDGAYAKSGKSGGLHGKKLFLDDVQTLCVSNGINASITKFRNNFVLNFNKKTTKMFQTAYCLKTGKLSRKPYDGDVWCIRTKYTNFMVRRNGVAYFTGNCFRINEYLEYFREIRAYHVLNGMIFSHIPIHPTSLGRFGCNIHGHLHSNRVLLDNGQIDPRYFSACVEHHNFAPIHMDDMIQMIKDQGGSVEMKQGNR